MVPKSYSAITRELPKHNPAVRRRLLVQLSVFLILEITSIIFAIACFTKPIPCNLPVTSAQAKAGLTVVLIVWHAIAVMNAQNIVMHGFSSEWYLRFLKKGYLMPGETDLVSTIASSILDKFRYFMAKEASIVYKLSFFVLWTLIALGSIAPGAIDFDDVATLTPTRLNVTNFTITGGKTGDPILNNPIVRAGLVLDLEQRMQSPFGLVTQENMIVGWPNVTVANLSGDLHFDSDVLVFNMSCWWERPSLNMTEWGTTWLGGDYVWYPYNTPLPGLKFFGGIMTMYRFNISQDHPVKGDYPAPFGAVPPVGLSGYIIFGRNSTVSNDPEIKNWTLNLDGLPTLYNPRGFNFTDVEGITAHFQTPLATFLLCDPQAQIMDGKILLTPSNASITVLKTTPIVGDFPRVGNISPDAANAVLSFSLLNAMEVDDDEAEMRVGARAATVLLNDSSLDFSGSSGSGLTFDAGLLPLDAIQRNLTKFLNSAAKGFSSYVRDYDKDPAPDSQLFFTSVGGMIEGFRAALVADMRILIVTIVLDGLIAFVLIVECVYLEIWRIPVFKLETLINYGRLTSFNERIKPSCKVAPKVLNTKPQPRMLITYLLIFVTLETSFTTLVFWCASHPTLIFLAPLSTGEIKGGFTIIFIVWHIIAIFLLSNATSFAFSSEWSRQLKNTNVLIPGLTDRVSRITSGGNDRASYFFGPGKPSPIFRVAFIVSLVLVGLNSLAPGALSVTKSKQTISVSVDIADLRILGLGKGPENSNNLDFLTDRACTLGMIEQHEDTVFQFDVEPNWFIPWPDRKSVSDVVGDTEYPTDLVAFRHDCTWRIPQVKTGEDTEWVIDEQAWKPWSGPLANVSYRGGILPMYRDLDMQPDPRTAYLFVGTNDSCLVNNDTDQRSIINLNGLPSLFHPLGLEINASETGTSRWTSPLSAFLLCDPHATTSGGRARLSVTNQLQVAQLSDSLIGNIPLGAVNTVFVNSLLTTLDTRDLTINTWTAILSTRVFLIDTSMDYRDFPRGVPVNDIDTINANLDRFFLSSSKAFIDGLHVDSVDKSKITPQMLSVAGVVEVECLTLIGTRLLGSAALGLWVLAMLMSGLLAWMIARDGGVTFDLVHLMDLLGDEFVDTLGNLPPARSFVQ